MYKFFSSNGYKIANAKVVIDQKTKQTRQFAYLNFYSPEEATRCLQEMNNVLLDGRQLSLSRKKDKTNEFDQNANLLVKNLSETIDQKALLNMFKEFGEIVSCKLEYDQNNKSKGFGYVQFSKVNDAQEAVKKLHGQKIDDKILIISVLERKNTREE